MRLGRNLIASCRELLAQLLRSTRAARRYPHVSFGHNAAIATDCSFGKNVRVYENTRLAAAKIGDYSYVGGGSRLQNVTIGKFCSIGPDVRIGLGVHPVDHVSTYPGFYSTTASGCTAFTTTSLIKEHTPIEIGHDVWVGAGATLMDGVNIGHGAVIGAGAVVARDVAPYSIVAGVPARRLRDRFDQEMVAFLLDFAWWDRDEAFLREKAPLFARPSAFRDELPS
ncbi:MULTISPECIES: CatB-related O-acetyltransferase [unclassified Mameliella]|uniref:CatB-related O-acetyltransferase n=1 Tax=unclassified Mameliella TaxID=2630630 RepID=UPI00273E6941|nr:MULTISPECIES: CatB-related O-acetyltransferase [unclassified Mameliella]